MTAINQNASLHTALRPSFLSQGRSPSPQGSPDSDARGKVPIDSTIPGETSKKS